MQDINTDKKTYILCAAIHYEDGIKYPHQPRNIEFGIVACGDTTIAFQHYIHYLVINMILHWQGYKDL